jgi:hypothetical protein
MLELVLPAFGAIKTLKTVFEDFGILYNIFAVALYRQSSTIASPVGE